MYEAFYGLTAKPFSILPDPDLIYWGSNHSLGYSILEFGLLNNAGFIVITGEIGSGKTTLVRHLLRKLESNVNVGLISNTPRSRDELLQWVMMSLGQSYQESYAALFHKFQNYLRDQYNKHRRTILIIDESQNLGIESLEELRMLSNINADNHQFLQVILVGQPQLKHLLRTPELLQFAQRVSTDFHLKPLTTEDVTKYIYFRLDAVGAREPIFSVEACQLIAQATGGIPRMINILSDTALVYGYAANTRWISEDLAKMVIDDKLDLGVLPLVSPMGVKNPKPPAPVFSMTKR